MNDESGKRLFADALPPTRNADGAYSHVVASVAAANVGRPSYDRTHYQGRTHQGTYVGVRVKMERDAVSDSPLPMTERSLEFGTDQGDNYARVAYVMGSYSVGFTMFESGFTKVPKPFAIDASNHGVPLSEAEISEALQSSEGESMAGRVIRFAMGKAHLRLAI